MGAHSMIWLAISVLALAACDDSSQVYTKPRTLPPDAGDPADTGPEDTEPDAPEPPEPDTSPEDVTEDILFDIEPDTADVPDEEDTSPIEDVGEDLGEDIGEDTVEEVIEDVVEEEPDPPAVCGDTLTEDDEACDDGNTDDGDYCSADCSTITGSCGDGIQQDIESCDDANTRDCTGTHDGGDGACVAEGTCSNGFTLDSNGECVSNPTGLSTPCQNGSGWSMFRFHYDNGSSSARIDVWDATCDYSFAPNSACNVRQVYPGFGNLDRTPAGDYIVNSREYIRVRFRANGLNFSRATVHFQARSYSTCCSTEARIWSPLYGDRLGGPVDNDFEFDWYSVDWTGHLFPSDQHGLTAIQIYAQGGSGSLAIRAVELCVE